MILYSYNTFVPLEVGDIIASEKVNTFIGILCNFEIIDIAVTHHAKDNSTDISLELRPLIEHNHTYKFDYIDFDDWKIITKNN